MDCEKLLHGNRDFKPWPKFFELDKQGKKVKTPETNFPYKCQREAVKYRVSGQSYTAFATLCKTHKKAAEREGFKLTEES